MRAGQIWSYKDPETGEVQGWRVESVWAGSAPPRDFDGACIRRVKPGGLAYYVPTLKGRIGGPMLATGGQSPNWTLIEDVS